MTIEHRQALQSEQALIGALLRDNDAIDEINGLKTQAFSREDHQIIFKNIIESIESGKPVDMIILAEELDRKGELKRVGDLDYIGALVQSACASKNVAVHAKSIDKQWKLRRLKALLDDLSNLTESRYDLDHILESAETELFNLLENEDESMIGTLKDAVCEAVDWIDSEQKGVSTGLRDLDRLIGGLCKGNLIIIAGRPSMGKSTCAVQIAENVARNEPVIVFSLEMTKREIGARFLRFHENRVGKSQAIAHSNNLKILIDDKPAITLSHIRSQCRKMKRKHGLGMIVIDYLQLMQSSGDNRNQEIGAISRGLKAIAKEFDIPVIALSQLSRKVDDRADKKPLMSDLRDSGEIEQDADMILFIYRDEVYHQNSDFKGTAEIIVRKNRNGSIGEITTTFNGQLTRFLDYNGQPILRSVKPAKKAFEYYETN